MSCKCFRWFGTFAPKIFSFNSLIIFFFFFRWTGTFVPKNCPAVMSMASVGPGQLSHDHQQQYSISLSSMSLQYLDIQYFCHKYRDTQYFCHQYLDVQYLCHKYHFNISQEEWGEQNFRDCNGVSNGIKLPDRFFFLILIYLSSRGGRTTLSSWLCSKPAPVNHFQVFLFSSKILNALGSVSDAVQT